ncbi:AEC family transporter [Frigidibacter albus]|uniref:AEC family transporter n=1 Tax=Frigidibacter albus TaxID=1465486 RepID=A0A6L8VMF1_9RHOB|nr:AEC family transporter [Frigidibacter albus]MZQ90559.1 AEC family transporter [Frigidibacter albus]NBE32321.1 AEC family transporter [Frigidibacter albus]GGH59161.1 hypothetical protein GCM10011341_30180 [Frigidibacter albus]
MDAVNAIVPLFAVILIGFLAVRSGYVPAESLRPVGEVVLRIALPALIFLSVAGAAPGDGLQPLALLAIGLGSLAAFACGVAAAVWGLRMPLRQAAMVGLGISASNSGFIGYPVVQQLYGTAEAGRLLAHMMVIENLVIIPLALILSSNAGGAVGLLRDLARNPLILALAAAIAFQMAGLSLPSHAARTLDLLARMSAPAALLVVGATLATLRPQGQAGATAVIVLGKLLLHPALTFAAFAVVGGSPAPFVLGAVLFAAMPMMSVYPILCQRAGLGPLAASALLAATILGTVTIPLWLPVLRQLGLG